MDTKGIEIDVDGLSTELGVPVIPVNPRKNKGIGQLKKVLVQTTKQIASLFKKKIL